MQTYLQQLEDRCREEGLDLRAVAKAEGFGNSTLWRWRSGHHQPSERKVRALFDRIDRMVRNQKRREGRASAPKTAA